MANCRLKADTKDTIEKKGRMTEADTKSVLNLLKGDSDCWVVSNVKYDKDDKWYADLTVEFKQP